MPRPALLVTGGLAAGKTAVVAELVAIAEERGVAAAAVDLDWLGWATGATAATEDLIARNLELVSATYAQAGVDRLALARAVVDERTIGHVRSALGSRTLEVVRLVAPPAIARRRLAARDSGAELAAHLGELGGFELRVAAASPGAPVVENGDRSLREVALEVWALARWDE